MPTTHAIRRPPPAGCPRRVRGLLYRRAAAARSAARKGGAAVLNDNIFLKVLDKTLPAKIVHEDEHCVAFQDINPQPPVHVLLIPRKVIPTHADVTPEDKEVLGHLHVVAARLAEKLGVADGYRL